MEEPDWIKTDRREGQSCKEQAGWWGLGKSKETFEKRKMVRNSTATGGAGEEKRKKSGYGTAIQSMSISRLLCPNDFV